MIISPDVEALVPLGSGPDIGGEAQFLSATIRGLALCVGHRKNSTAQQLNLISGGTQCHSQPHVHVIAFVHHS